MMKTSSNKWERVLWVLLPFFIGLIALSLGRYTLSLQDVITSLLSPLGIQATNDAATLIVLNVRLPRIIIAFIVGAGLAVAGAVFQSVFANPLASPDTLGVSSGAAFGAALALLFSAGAFIVQLSALAIGILAIVVTFGLSKMKGQSNILLIVLAGVITSAFFTALISAIKYVADPSEKLPEITYWLMGSLVNATWEKLLFAGPIIVVCMIGIYLLRWRLNILILSEEEIASMGMKVKYIRWTVIMLATFIIAASVSIVGQVGWIGLVIPHIARTLVGSDHRRMIPATISLGGIYLIIIDTIARSVIAGEIPLSILTALIGAPIFAFLFFRKGSAWY